MKPAFFRLLQFNPKPEAIKIFIKNDASCVDPYQEENLLYRLALCGSGPAAPDVLLLKGAKVNGVDRRGETHLHKLLQRSIVPIKLLQAMLKAGAYLSLMTVDLSVTSRVHNVKSAQVARWIVTDKNVVPLDEVCEYGSAEALHELLIHSPTPNLEDKDVS